MNDWLPRENVERPERLLDAVGELIVNSPLSEDYIITILRQAGKLASLGVCPDVILMNKIAWREYENRCETAKREGENPFYGERVGSVE